MLKLLSEKVWLTVALLVAVIVLAAGTAKAQGRRENITVVNGGGGSSVVQKSGGGLFGRRESLTVVNGGGANVAQVRDRRNNILLVQDQPQVKFVQPVQAVKVQRVVAVQQNVYTPAQQQFLLRLEQGGCSHCR